jgi:hypothetical protein
MATTSPLGSRDPDGEAVFQAPVPKHSPLMVPSAAIDLEQKLEAKVISPV